jgi:hypothetical protein
MLERIGAMPEKAAKTIVSRERLSAGISVLVAVVAALAGMATVVSSWFWPEVTEIRDIVRNPRMIETKVLDEELKRMRRDQELILKALNRPPENLQIRVLAERLESISRRQNGIEQAIMANPTRALELPMLRNDLNNMREVNAQQLEAIKAGVDQSYDMNKWLLGTIVITIIGLAISNLLTRKKEGE